MAVGIGQGLLYLFVIEIEAGEMTRIGFVPKTDVDRIRAVIDGRLE
jgi:hypothetical protein